MIISASYIDPTAMVIGNVKIGRNVFVGPGAVIRADEPGSEIEIKEGCNVQDGVVIHAFAESSVLVDENTSLAHGCIVHGPCSIGRNCFVGFGSVIIDSTLENGVFIKHLCCVEGVRIPRERFVESGETIRVQEKASLLSHARKEHKDLAKKVIEMNMKLAKGYSK